MIYRPLQLFLHSCGVGRCFQLRSVLRGSAFFCTPGSVIHLAKLSLYLCVGSLRSTELSCIALLLSCSSSSCLSSSAVHNSNRVWCAWKSSKSFAMEANNLSWTANKQVLWTYSLTEMSVTSRAVIQQQTTDGRWRADTETRTRKGGWLRRLKVGWGRDYYFKEEIMRAVEEGRKTWRLKERDERRRCRPLGWMNGWP